MLTECYPASAIGDPPMSPKISPKPWSFCEQSKSILDADGRSVCGFFSGDDDGRWVASVRSRFDDIVLEANKLASRAEELERRLKAQDSLIKAMKEELGQAQWWVTRYFEARTSQ
ncbi:hypothetical protein EBX31_01860 [bacterium]|nr:hypothetical protein [bacterium]